MSGFDDGDRKKAGTFPHDPTEGTVPFEQWESGAGPSSTRTAANSSGGTVGVSPAGIDLDALHVGRALNEAQDRMMRRARDEERAIPVPWEGLAEALGGGLWTEQVSVLVSNTATGKTQCALQMADHAASLGFPTLYIGLELGPLDTSARLLGLRARVKWSRLYLGHLPPAELDSLIKTHSPHLADCPLYLSFASPHGWSYENLRPLVEALRARFPEKLDADGRTVRGSRPLLVVLDFLQLVAGPEKEELRERIANASYAARAVSLDFDAAVLLVSSTARENYTKLAGDGDKQIGAGNPARFIGLGKESGEIEFAASNLLVLQREPWPGDTPPANGTMTHLGVAKVRARTENAPSWVRLVFDGSRFDEVKGPTGASPASDADDSAAPSVNDGGDEEYPF